MVKPCPPLISSTAWHSDFQLPTRLRWTGQRYCDTIGPHCTTIVQDYARRLGYAERTVTRACLAYFGKTAKALIDARLVLEAKRLLAHGGGSVDAISLQLGFDDSSPMVRFFKRLQGVTPQAFRRTLGDPVR